MATFEVKVTKILDIMAHPNADALEFALVHGYKSIVQKNRFKKGDWVVYLPEASLIPEYLLKKLNLWDNEKNIGKLVGKKGNRLKAIKLRGELSQGLILGLENSDGVLFLENETTKYEVKPGQDVAELLGVKKWEPELPPSMAGEVFRLSPLTSKYDIENYQRWPNIFEPGENVVVTEKIHGTCFVVGNVPGLNSQEGFGDWVVGSKGQSSQGLFFKNNNNDQNVYVKMFKEVFTNIFQEKILELRKSGIFGLDENTPIVFFGEIFGKGIQDLEYGTNKAEYRVFDIWLGDKHFGRFLNVDEKKEMINKLGLEMVPILYEGPWNEDVVVKLRDGKTTLNGENIREGVVITPRFEDAHPDLGRVILKWVSPNYLTRSGNVTEYN